ncbi:hypothetical protein J1N35_046214 [Gossypium stocksii]|uniref:Uncharacterized protein n=1 Tax=Gossypium stocksii TaxID=47602 RepID=A0A9D3U5A5_9ROSI|nr:hypothetical protein J1N35_046214 [Gossypium stocksii]
MEIEDTSIHLEEIQYQLVRKSLTGRSNEKSEFGRSDAFIPTKKSKGGTRFGFVRSASFQLNHGRKMYGSGEGVMDRS